MVSSLGPLMTFGLVQMTGNFEIRVSYAPFFHLIPRDCENPYASRTI